MELAGEQAAPAAPAPEAAERSPVIADVPPGKPAVIMADGSGLVTYGELEARSRQVARLLASLGVEQAAEPTKPAAETTAAPVLQVLAGASLGAVKLKCGRVPHAGSYVFQYKLEPSQPTDPWLVTIPTKLASTIVGAAAAVPSACCDSSSGERKFMCRTSIGWRC